MNEIEKICAKYNRAYLKRLLASSAEADQLAVTFFEDVAGILDVLTRLKNVERNPTGFSIDDAPILGLLVRTWKLLQLVVWIYKEDSAEYAAIAERALLEAAVTATFLLRSDKTTMEDYRRCSYRHRLRMLEQAASGSEYYRSKAGKRLLRSIKKKLALEGLDEDSFEEQTQNHWRVQRKTFHSIFKEVVGDDLYAVAYGTASESVHGSWHDVRNFSLRGDVARGFLPLYDPLRESVGHVSLIIPFATLPFRVWAVRVQLDHPYITKSWTPLTSSTGYCSKSTGASSTGCDVASNSRPSLGCSRARAAALLHPSHASLITTALPIAPGSPLVTSLGPDLSQRPDVPAGPPRVSIGERLLHDAPHPHEHLPHLQGADAPGRGPAGQQAAASAATSVPRAGVRRVELGSAFLGSGGCGGVADSRRAPGGEDVVHGGQTDVRESEGIEGPVQLFARVRALHSSRVDLCGAPSCESLSRPRQRVTMTPTRARERLSH